MSTHVPSRKTAPEIFVTPVKPAAIVGCIAAVAGLTFGAFRGVVTGRRPIVSALTVGATWTGFASVYWYSRLCMMQAFVEDSPSTRQKLLYSTVAGGISGGVNAGLNRGARFIWPASVFCSGLGFLGQACSNGVESLESSDDGKPSLRQRVMSAFSSPIRPISEERYEELLSEKLYQTRAEITALDERINIIRMSTAEEAKIDVVKE